MSSSPAPLSWNQILQLDLSISRDPKTFSRDSAVLERYSKFTADVKDRYESIQTYILHKVFEAPVVSVADKLTIDTSYNHLWSSEAGAPLIVKLVKNDFPYAVEEGVHHLVLWSNASLTSEQIKDYLDRHLLPQGEYVFFENPTHLKTIPGIFHVHVFAKISIT